MSNLRHAIRNNDPHYVISSPWDNDKLVHCVLIGAMDASDLGLAPSPDHPNVVRLKNAGKLDGVRVRFQKDRFDEMTFVKGSGGSQRSGYDATDKSFY